MIEGRPVRFARDALVTVMCLALGFGSVVVWRTLRSRGEEGANADASPRVGLDDLARRRSARPLAVEPFGAAAEPPAPAAPDPTVAVERFLGAEIAREFAVSYGLLSAADRDRLGSRAEWEATHGELPEIRAFTVVPNGSGPDPERVEVQTDLDLRPMLDETLGLVPARAHATWVAVAEDGGWRVAFAERRIDPRYPSESDAPRAVRAWTRDRAHCDRRSATERRGGLLGAAGLAEGLCGAGVNADVGTPGPLEPDAGVEPFLAAYGPEVFSWARVVPVTGPVAIGAVVAPVGDHWLVIGVVESSPGSFS